MKSNAKPVWLGIFFYFVLSVVCETSAPAQAPPPATPMLRIEAAMHTALITSIDVDAGERYLVSGSVDKTSRVWDLASGRLLRTLRFPINEGNDGKIAAVAISPDGRTIACGGWTGNDWDHSNSIYLFDRESGRLYRRLSGLPDTILHLSFAPDGQWLVATIGNNHGIRLYRTTDWALVAEDHDYGDSSNWADFGVASEGGRAVLLATASHDGFVRLYTVGPSGAVQLLSKQKPSGGNRSHCVRISPDGTRVAVWFEDSPVLEVLSAVNLSHLYSPDSRPAQGLSAAAWSADGKYLYAATTSEKEATIISWSDGGKGPKSTIHTATSIILGLHALRGGISFTSGAPEIGRLDQEGKRLWVRDSPIADFRALSNNFLISTDASNVKFAYQLNGVSPAWFSATDRILSQGARLPMLQGRPPVIDGLPIANWQDHYGPTLNGIPLRLAAQSEAAHSLAILPGGQEFLLGTEWYLWLFDRAGNQKWRVAAPGRVLNVNASAGGVSVATLGDGTIRWYRTRDGVELLALFPHPDGRRWVLWTTSGYYDASPGAEDLLGWHVNNGSSAAADFFPASRFRSSYYRPDIVARVLQTLDETEAVRLADAEVGRRNREQSIVKITPPVVKVLSPTDGTEIRTREVAVQYEARTPSGEPVTLLRVLIDGRPADVPRSLLTEPGSNNSRTLRVTIPERDCELSLIAENRYAASEPATVHLVWRGAQQTVTQSRLFLLAIGISQYPEKFKLQWASKDAQDFATAMQRQKGVLYRDVQVKLLRDGDATHDAILDGLEWVEKNTTQNDVGMLFLSGHGWNDTSGTYYFIPVNFEADRLRRTAVPAAEVQKTVQAMAGKVVVFLDTCYSGNVLGGRSGDLRADINGVANELMSAENGAVVFTASSGRQVALERPEWGNGAFTKALMEGLGGKADMLGKGRITINALDYYISERVRELTDNQQTPTTAKPQTIADFPIAIRR